MNSTTPPTGLHHYLHYAASNSPYEKTDMAIHQKCSASYKNTLYKILLDLDKLYQVHISHENMENVAIGNALLYLLQ